MCYSAMVEQNAKKLALRYNARIQTDLYDDLFSRRLKGEKLYIGKGLEQSFMENPDITEWHENEIHRLEQGIFAQKTRLDGAIKALKTKVTKKAENDQRIATEKIEKFKRDLERHKTKGLSDSDSRIYPLHYFSMLTVDDKGKMIVVPTRYLMRPSDKDESFDQEYYGCFNARFDNLSRVAWWKNSLEKHRGIILVKKFFENVPTENYIKKNKLDNESKQKKSLVISFEPDGMEYMCVPVLFDIWKKKGAATLYSAAIITDEPTPEILDAGHDRTPIFLKESAIVDWLTAKGEAKDIKAVLGEREVPFYSHKVLGAA